MGAQSVDNIIGFVENEKLKNVLLKQKEVMEEFYKKAASELTEQELEDAKTNPMQRVMLKAGVKMNVGLNNSSSHIASMMIDGYNMGIESVQKCINELKKDGVDVPQLAGDLMKVYDKDIKELREYL